ncbi:MAG: PKD domain-containing protein [Acidobacteriota bacterium]
MPSDRWGPTLQPVAILGDTTNFVGHRDPENGETKEYHDVDVENGYLFVATGQGMVIYDLRTNPTPRFYLSYIYGANPRKDGTPVGYFPSWDHSDKDWYVKEVDAPPGFDGLVALSLDDQGFSVINTQVKSHPIVAYQRTLGVTRVYAFTSGGTHQAYAIATAGGRIHRFSLSATAGMNGCLEVVKPDAPPPINCPGVYKGEVTGFGPVFHNDIQGFGSFVATSSLDAAAGVQVWSIANPDLPVLRMQIPGKNLAVALWQQESSIYLARLNNLGQLSIHDASCIAAAGPCAAGPALWTATPAKRGALTSLKLSFDGGHSYLYVGGDDLGENPGPGAPSSCIPQREHLYDVSIPGAPVELTPRTHPAGYWGWYYMECSTGFNLVGPRRAEVYNGVLYRAAYSLLDAHRVAGDGPARVNSVGTPPPPLVVCQPVTFTAQGVSGKPTVFYSWTLTDAALAPIPVGSSTGTLVWNTDSSTPPGTYTATVTVTNTLGSESKSAAVTLGSLPPLPAAGFLPARDPFTGSTVTFHANAPGATGWNWDFDGDGIFDEAGWTSDPQSGPNPTFTYATLGTRQVRVKVRNCQNMAGVVSAALPVDIVGGKITINGPASGQAGQPIQFAAFGSEGCNPSAGGWTWTAEAAPPPVQSEDRVTVSWPATTRGTRAVRARNSACPNVVGSTQILIVAPLKACFTVESPSLSPGQPITFNGTCSTGSPTGFFWTFGDGTPIVAGDARVPHVYAQPGTYTVSLTISRQGQECPGGGFCESPPEAKMITVVSPLVADFTWEPSCQQSPCDAEVGRPVTFTDRSSGNPTGWSWTFGDGGTATGKVVSHTFARRGDFQVTLTASLGSVTAVATKTVPVVLRSSAVVVPWVARNRGALVQTSDLYVTNPGTDPMDVLIELRRRGAPELNPPRVARRIAPGATLYAADCIKSLFGRDENLSGYILVKPGLNSPQPVVTAHQTSGPPGTAFGMAVQGIPLTSAGAGLQLVGMNDNSKRASSLGITNPNDAPATYRLRFFNAAGQAIGTPSGDLSLSRFRQQQFQADEIRSRFGITGQDDYRVAVEPTSGSLFPFGVDVWTSTGDPSLAGNGPGRVGRAWLIGVSNKPGADGKPWKTDAVLSNTTGQPLAVNLTFIPLGVAGAPTAPSRVTLAAGKTQRLEDVLKKQWNLTNAVGVLAIDSDPAGGALPAVFAESYRSPLVGQRYGHSMAVMTEADAAAAGRVHSLAGLRQDGQNRTTIWVLNAGTETGDFDVIYRGLDGAELGRIVVRLAPGRVRQLAPAQHPLPEAGVPDGFTVEIQVRSGRPLTAAQVVHNANDSEYVRGVTP